jgi:hypothetical protein
LYGSKADLTSFSFRGFFFLALNEPSPQGHHESESPTEIMGQKMNPTHPLSRFLINQKSLQPLWGRLLRVIIMFPSYPQYKKEMGLTYEYFHI